MTAPTPLNRCAHDQVDVEALLADDRLAAALAAPIVPGTEKNDLHLWLIRLYRHIAKNKATVAGACALLRAHPISSGKYPCTIAQIVWNRSDEQEPLTDTGNSRRLATLSGTDTTFDAAAGWRIWAGSAWQGDSEGVVVQRRAKGVSAVLEEEAEALHTLGIARGGIPGRPQDPPTEGDKLLDRSYKTKSFAKGSQSSKLITAMTKLVRDEPGVLTRGESWDANPRLLACPDATVELTPHGHLIREPRRADRLIKIARGRPGTGTPTPLWEASLVWWLPDVEVRNYVQRLVGYGLYGGNPLRLLPVFIGPTSTGKTTFGEIIRHVLGEHAGPFSLALFRGKMDEGPRQDIVKALGRRIIVASEVSARWELHADEVKRLTGNDSVQARDAYAKAAAMVERQPAFMPILCTNNAPTILDADPATWRRLVAVPWEATVSPADQDENLAEKIRTQETNGVLDWLLAGYDAYCADGLGEQPHAVVQATMKLRDSLTVRDHWLCQETSPGEDHWDTSDRLWGAFAEWCKGSGVSEQQRGTKIGFTRWLGGRPGIEPHKADGVRGWRGVRLGQSGFADHEPR